MIWNLSHTSIDAAQTSFTDISIMSCTCSSHFSTAPRASDVEIVWLILTFSPSLLNMAWISSLLSNSSLAMPSKHFFRWGCTRSGSLVSDRISNISSLDKKKNRGKKSRFFSRYAFRPFMILSRRPLLSCSFSNNPERLVADNTWRETNIIVRHCPVAFLIL